MSLSEQYERAQLARKAYNAAVWMRQNRIARLDCLPHDVAVQAAWKWWTDELLLLGELEGKS